MFSGFRPTVCSVRTHSQCRSEIMQFSQEEKFGARRFLSTRCVSSSALVPSVSFPFFGKLIKLIKITITTVMAGASW